MQASNNSQRSGFRELINRRLKESAIARRLLGATSSQPEFSSGARGPSEKHKGMLDYSSTYRSFIDGLLELHPRDKAMELAVGGNYEATAAILGQIVKSHGLAPEHCLIDVGCGSGRLAFGLRNYLQGNYLGTDVVAKLLQYASERCRRQTWRFQVVDSIEIPAQASCADMVCFFSVFTHLLHEDSYRYLLEAKRVLRPDGKAVFSFLEFREPTHWEVFRSLLETPGGTQHIHMQFLSRDAIEAWSPNLGMVLETITDGGPPLGQSVCVLRKPREADGVR
jgi:SAM-dependent methyltransferase